MSTVWLEGSSWHKKVQCGYGIDFSWVDGVKLSSRGMTVKAAW